MDKKIESIKDNISSLNELNPEQKNAVEEYDTKEILRQKNGKTLSIVQGFIGILIILSFVIWGQNVPEDGGDDKTAYTFAVIFFLFAFNIAIYLYRKRIIGAYGEAYKRGKVISNFDSSDQKSTRSLISRYSMIIFIVVVILAIFISILSYL